MAPLVSLIIPVYNSEKYLSNFLDSVIEQNYENLEVLIVDDGSTDKSGTICKSYEKKDNRITVFVKQNGGQASARNLALENCKGEYIAFADSDDLLKNNYISKMIEYAIENDADFVQCSSIRIWEENIIPEETKVKFEVMNTTNALKEFCYQRKITPAPWCKLIKRSVWGEIRFPEGVGYEDYAIMYKVLGNSTKILYSTEKIYSYRIHKNSSQHLSFSEKKKDRVLIAEELLNYINACYPNLATPALTRYSLAQLQYLMELPFKKELSLEKKETFNRLRKVRKIVLKDKGAPLKIKSMIFFSYLGPDMLMLLGRIYVIVVRR